MDSKLQCQTRDTNSNAYSWEMQRQRIKRNERGGEEDKQQKVRDKRMKAKGEEREREMKAAGTPASLK